MRAGRRSRALLGALVLAVVAVASFPTSADAKTRRPKPRWDADVERIAHEVEDIRGLKFDGPVRVDFLTNSEFTNLVSDGFGGGPGGLRRRERILKSLGLLATDDDLAEAFRNFGDEGFLGFYSATVVVRGNEDSVLTQYILAHELTHALHDDNFGFGLDVDFDDALESDGFRSIEEGDASRVAELWLERQSPKRRARFDQEYAELVDRIQRGSAEVPHVLISEGSAVYEFGEAFTEAVVADGGQRALDSLFRHPPTDDARVLNVQRDAGRRILVDVPEVDDGGRRVGRKENVGALGLFHILASRIDPIVALDAADRWGGDELILVEQTENDCVRAAFTGREDGDTEVIAAALTQWAAAHGAALAGVEDDLATLTACAGSASPPPRSSLAGDLVALTRNRIVTGGLDEGADAAEIDCAVDVYFGDGALTTAVFAADLRSPDKPDDVVSLLAERRDAVKRECRFDAGSVFDPYR